MIQEDRRRIEARLDGRLEELMLMRSSMLREADGMRGSEPDVDNHPADQGSELHDEELDETTRILLADDEQRIRDARRALADGSYGTCVECGRQIPVERLEAMPESVRCYDCQRLHEGRIRQRGSV